MTDSGHTFSYTLLLAIKRNTTNATAMAGFLTGIIETCNFGTFYRYGIMIASIYVQVILLRHAQNNVKQHCRFAIEIMKHRLRKFSSYYTKEIRRVSGNSV